MELHEVKEILLTAFGCKADPDDDDDEKTSFLLSEEAAQQWFIQFQRLSNFSACCVSLRPD